MSDPVEQVGQLRDRVQRDEQELDAAVRELAGAARRLADPADWIRDHSVEWIRAHPWVALLGATALGLLLARLTRSDR